MSVSFWKNDCIKPKQGNCEMKYFYIQMVISHKQINITIKSYEKSQHLLRMAVSAADTNLL